MFGHHAQELLRMAGHSATVPGAIPAEDVAGAASRLRAALERKPEEGEPDSEAEGDEEPAVPLGRRAFPLLELMDRAVAEACGIRWGKATSW